MKSFLSTYREPPVEVLDEIKEGLLVAAMGHVVEHRLPLGAYDTQPCHRRSSWPEL